MQGQIDRSLIRSQRALSVALSSSEKEAPFEEASLEEASSEDATGQDRTQVQGLASSSIRE